MGIGMSDDKENLQIFLIGPKREENYLKNIVFGEIDVPEEDEIKFLFDKRNSWIVCQITCCSADYFDRLCSQLNDSLR